MKLPIITINGTQLDILDYLAILGVVLVLIGLALLGAPYLIVGIGLAAIAASRVEWDSSTSSSSDQKQNPGSPQPTVVPEQ